MCVSYFVFIPLRIRLTSLIPLLDLTLSVLHSAHIPFRVCPNPCVSQSMCPTPISHSQCIPLRAYPISCVSHSVCILSHVCALLLYLTPCVSPSYVSHSVSLREYLLCVYLTPYMPNFGCLTPHVCPTSISHFKCISLRAYPNPCVPHSACVPFRVYPIS